jgi:hypothetical protein
MVVAIVALVVAMSGSAVAASTLVGGNSLIKKNSLSGNRLQNRSVTGSKIKLSTLGTVPSATKATSATTATTATTAGAAPIAQVTYVTATVTVPDTGAATTGTAACPSATTVLGGGGSIADTAEGFIDQTYPSGKTGWTVVFADDGAAATTTGTVYAICAPAAATAP